MPIASPITVAAAVKHVAKDAFLLPGIQRGFVWRAAQIERLFDSIMRGYPIGTLLMWQTRPEDHPQLPFMRLATDALVRDTELTEVKPPKSKNLLAVLDGQQRLTALNVALRGSLSTAVQAPKRRLFIDLDANDPTAGSETNQFTFQFRISGDSSEAAWFPVSDALGVKSDKASLDRMLAVGGLDASVLRRSVLRRLVVALNDERFVGFGVERGNLDRVLNVFARANNGGTTLTYVDLLVSTATARWKTRNAAAEIHALRKAMNARSQEGFNFTPDRIVKAGLVLLDVPEPKFHVDSFMSGNRARRLEDMWPDFQRAMEIAAGLLAEFGLSGRTLPAENVAIPLAYYAHHRGLTPTYVTAASHEGDRARVRAFVARTLLQRRYWTGAVDPVLVKTRDAIRTHGATAFPLEKIASALAREKPIDVTDDFVDELASLKFGDRRTAVLLRLLFPHMVHGWSSTTSLDKDHIFPLSKYSAGQKPPTGTSYSYWSALCEWADRLPNLQLLRKEDNRGGGKVAKLPKEWLAELTPPTRARYSKQHVTHVPANIADAMAFWDSREEKLKADIRKLLKA